MNRKQRRADPYISLMNLDLTDAEAAALVTLRKQARKIQVAKANRLFEHRLKHRREIAGRGIDDLQYLTAAACCASASSRSPVRSSSLRCNSVLVQYEGPEWGRKTS
jgi:hypothetical protein